MDETDIDIKFHTGLGYFSSLVTQESIKEGEQEEITTTYAIENVQPLEYYLNINEQDRRESFFETLSLNEVAVGEVVSVKKNLLDVRLNCLLTGQKRWIADLNILGTCEFDTLSNDPSDEIETGDKVKGVVTYIERITREIKLSFEEKYLLQEFIDHFPLGRLDEGQVELLESINSRHSQFDENAFEKDLAGSYSFRHPQCMKRLAKDLGIDEKCGSFMKHRKSTVCFNESLETLRDRQSCKYSMKITGIGVQLFREGNAKEAFEHFDRAIALYPKNIEAFVARGALKANKEKLQEAIKDFRDALQINPKHRNGSNYLIETLLSFAKNHERLSKWKDASRCYKEVLSLDNNHTLAKERFQQIQQILSNKILAGSRLQPPNTDLKNKPESVNVKDKSQEKIQRLKELLTQGSSKRNSESSASSSSESSSESSDGWVEKRGGNTPKKTAHPDALHKHRRSSYSAHKRAFVSRDAKRPRSRSPVHRREQKYRRKTIDFSDVNKNITNIKQSSSISKEVVQILPDTMTKKLKHFSTDEMTLVSKLLKGSKDSEKSASCSTDTSLTSTTYDKTKRTSKEDRESGYRDNKHRRHYGERSHHRSSFHKR